MAKRKAKKRTAADEEKARWQDWGNAIKRQRDPDYLLDQIEADVRRYTKDLLQIRRVGKRGFEMTPAVEHGRSALECVKLARGGDVAAATLAERYLWLMRWELMGIDSLLANADRALARWCDRFIECSPLQKSMLETIGDEDCMDAAAFIRDVWNESYKEPRPNKYDRALSKLSKKLQASGLPYRFSFRRGQIIVKKLHSDR